MPLSQSKNLQYSFNIVNIAFLLSLYQIGVVVDIQYSIEIHQIKQLSPK